MEVDGPQLDATVPVALLRDGKVSLELIGSGLIARIAGQDLLLTAAHVLDGRELGRLFIPGEGEVFVPVKGPVYRSNAPLGDREKDSMDIGYVLLGKEAQFVLDPKVTPLKEGDLQADPVSSEGPVFYTFFGHPWRKATRRGRDISSAPVPYSGTGLNRQTLIRHGLDPQKHIAIRFHRKKSRRVGHNRMTAPLPHGISGGGIFAWATYPRGLNSTPTGLFLAGIAHSFCERRCIMFGTKINFLVAEIRDGSAQESSWDQGRR